MRMLPSVGSKKRASKSTSVLLPDPLGPTSATMLPFGTSNETSCSAGSPSRYANDTRSYSMTRSKARSGLGAGGPTISGVASRNSKTRSAATRPG